MTNAIYSPQEFVAKLNSGQFDTDNAIVIEGFVRASDDENAISFSPGRSCVTWVDIPLSAIENIEYLGPRNCREHTHAAARISFATPFDPVAQPFVDLLRTSISGPQNPLTPDDAKAQLKSILEAGGAVFADSRVHLDLGQHGTLELDESVILEPSEKNSQVLHNALSEIGIEVETFDVNDPQYEMKFAGTRHRTIGRITERTEYVCCPIRQRRYYKYATISAAAADVDEEAFGKMVLWASCVWSTLGALSYFGLLAAATTVWGVVALVTAIGAMCIGIVASVTEDDQRATALTSYIGR